MTEEKNFKPFSATPESVYRLAVDLDRFTEDFYTYVYRSVVGDVKAKEENIHNIAHDIDKGKTDYIQDWLQWCIDDNYSPEQTKTAESLLRRLNLIQCKN